MIFGKTFYMNSKLLTKFEKDVARRIKRLHKYLENFINDKIAEKTNENTYIIDKLIQKYE